MEMSAAGMSSREEQVAQVIAEYLQAAEAGRAPDSADFLARHPEMRAEIEEFFAGRNLLKGVRDRLADSSRSPANPPIIGDEDAPGPLGASHPICFGDYEVLREIARGGMGIVYEARQRSLRRVVALKVVVAGRLSRPSERERFRQEALAAARLGHPGIVPIYEVGEAQGTPYYTMKLIGGGSLAKRGPEIRGDWRRIASLMAAVARAMEFGHGKGVIHRDLKPANIILEDDGRPVVTDFGLAKVLDGSLSLTATGALLGTPNYMAPEQVRRSPEDKPSPAVDIYGLGALLYELLAGKPPFASGSTVEVLRRICEEMPEPITRTVPGVPRDLETICHKALEKQPAQRYRTALELAEDLERFLAGEPIRARRVTTIERGWRWGRRRKAGLAAAAVAVALGAAMGAALLQRAPTAPAGSPAALKEMVEKREREVQLRMVGAAHLREAYQEAEDPKSRGSALEKLKSALRDGAEGGFVGFEHRHLLLGLHPEAARYTILEGGLGDLAFNSDGRGLIVSSRNVVYLLASDPLSRIWSFESVKAFPPVFSEDGKLMLGPNSRGGILVWDTRARRLVFDSSTFGVRPRILAAAFSPDARRAVSAHENGVIHFWDLEAMTTSHAFSSYRHPIRCLAFLPDGTRLLTAGDDRTVRLWDTTSWQEAGRLEGLPQVPESLAITADGLLLVTADGGEEVRYFGLKDKVLLGTIRRSAMPSPRALDLDRKRSLLAVCSGPNAIEVWKLPEGQSMAALTTPRGPVRGVRFSSDGRRLAAWSAGGSVMVWDGTSWTFHAGIEAHPQGVADACFSPDADNLATAGEDGTIKLWHVPARPFEAGEHGPWGDPHQAISVSGKQVERVGVTPNGSLLITETDKQVYEAWDLTPWQGGGVVSRIGALPIDAGAYLQSLVAPDASCIAGLQSDRRVRILALRRAAGEALPQLVPAGEGPWPGISEKGTAVFSPRVDRFFALSADGLVGVWRREESGGLAAWTWDRPFRLPWDKVNRAAIAVDLSLLAFSRYRDPRIYIWDLAAGREVGVFEGHSQWVLSFSFSPDFRTLASGGLDHELRLWDVEGNPGAWRIRERGLMREHTGAVSFLLHSPDGRTLVSWSDDGLAGFWDPLLGYRRAWARLPPGNKQFGCFSADGSVLVLCGRDSGRNEGVVHLLRAPQGEESVQRWGSESSFGIYLTDRERVAAGRSQGPGSRSVSPGARYEAVPSADPADCSVRNFQARFEVSTGRVRCSWNPGPGDSGFRVFQGERLIAELPGEAASVEDENPPAAVDLKYNLVLLGGRRLPGRPCDSSPIQTFVGPQDLICCPHQAAREVEVAWKAPRHVAPDGFLLRRDGAVISQLGPASSFIDRAVPPGEHRYEVQMVLGGMELGPAVHCATNITGVAAPGRGCGDAVIVQYDFEGDLKPTIGHHDLEPMTGPPLRSGSPPAFQFEEREISGGKAKVCRYGNGTGFRLFTGMAPNGGGRRVNQYTLIMDWMVEAGALDETGHASLFSADSRNLMDGLWWVRASNRRIGTYGDSGGRIDDDTWYRLAFVGDLTDGTVSCFVNGEKQAIVRPKRDLAGGYTLASLEDGTSGFLLLFADDNGENSAGVVNSVQLRDVALTDKEVAAFGGPSAGGIPVSPP